jgi:hypothetical protein
MASTARTFVVSLALALPASLALTGTARADELLIENVASGQTAAAERPTRGSSMARVESRFGAPTSRSGPVGQPPITRWEYPGFVVFFEYDHVVHAVGR